MANQRPPHIFWISELAFLLLAVFCIVQAIELSKPKARMKKLSGRITLLSKHYQDRDSRSPGEMRFIKIATYPEVFELYAGKPGGDNRPKLEKLDSLKTGDVITLSCI